MNWSHKTTASVLNALNASQLVCKITFELLVHLITFTNRCFTNGVQNTVKM